jgi:AcrR family transcriptional regulator
MAEREGPGEGRSYHHGSLRESLIATAERLLAERGVDGFTLRECARRAGVSPAAPAHHFGNVTGLLTAIATLGFDGLADAMEAGAAESDGTPRGRLEGIGRGYIRFALAHPARFRVIFGRFPLNKAEPRFAAAAERAYGCLAATIAVAAREAGLDPDAERAALVVAWSTVHGFANLVLDGQTPFIAAGEDREAAIEALADRIVRLFPAALAAGLGGSP